MNYKIIAKGEKRTFSITVGLREGYNENGVVFTLGDVIDIHHKWQEDQQQIFGVLIEKITICYGKIINGKIMSFQEPGCRVSGEIIIDEVSMFALVMNLAKELGAELDQKRVYINILDKSYILEREK